MPYDYDVAVIGTGTSAHFVINTCLEAGLEVAVVDRQAYGGTCAMRGCQPKKYLVAAAEAVHRCRQMTHIGVCGRPQIDWPALMQSKNAFTGPIPERTENGFRKKGAVTLRGTARFTGSERIAVDGREISARHIVIAAGAVPRRLNIPGEELLTSSGRFMRLDRMPKRVVFVGGGFISMEFAGIAALCGAEVWVLQREPRVLLPFDPDLVDALAAAYRDMGVHIVTQACVDRIDRQGPDLVAACTDTGGQTFRCDIAVHGAGRVPDLEALDLDAGAVAYSARGVTVNEYLQSISNPAVYAVGDAAATAYQLATTADQEGVVAAENIISGNRRIPDLSVVPSAAFTLPPLAAVGISEAEALESNAEVVVNKGKMTGWPSSRRIGQNHAAYKIILGKDTGRILGAHLLGHNADEVINVFALAIRLKLTGKDLKEMLWAYPSYTSDLKYMVG
jgi:glutathione reductase (NADPH)